MTRPCTIGAWAVGADGSIGERVAWRDHNDRAARPAHALGPRGARQEAAHPHCVCPAGAGHVRVADYGTLGGRSEAHDVTGLLRSEVPYMAPEHASNFFCGLAADVFSFGCLLAHVVTGVAPYAAAAEPSHKAPADPHAQEEEDGALWPSELLVESSPAEGARAPRTAEGSSYVLMIKVMMNRRRPCTSSRCLDGQKLRWIEV